MRLGPSVTIILVKLSVVVGKKCLNNMANGAIYRGKLDVSYTLGTFA